MNGSRKIRNGLLVVLVFLLLILGKTSYASKDDYFSVKIGSFNYGQSLKLESENGIRILDKAKRQIYSTGEKKLDIIVDKGSKSLLIRDGKVEKKIDLVDELYIGDFLSDKNPISINGSKYRGYLKFIEDSNSLINYIDIELYLLGVLPREMSPSSKIEALKAQALAARSFTYGNKNKHLSAGYNLCNSTCCQVYSGYSVEDERSTRAVRETRGEYMTYEGQIINASYHSTSGGHTEDSGNVWGGHRPYLKGKEDPYSSYESVRNDWEIDLDPLEIKSKLAARGVNIGEIQAIEINEISPSKRVMKMTIIGTKSNEVMTGNQFRTMMGATKLRSSMFQLSPIDDETESGQTSNYNLNYIDGKNNIKNLEKTMVVLDGEGNYRPLVGELYVYDGLTTNKYSPSTSKGPSGIKRGLKIYGRGYGHGVGMSQRGAMEMARQGFTYRDIVNFYYTGIDVEKN